MTKFDSRVSRLISDSAEETILLFNHFGRKWITQIKDTYAKQCPHCSHEYVCEIDDGKDCFTLGRRYWVHYCEMDDNLHSDEIFYCPYCGENLIIHIDSSG
jgi:uncharacterized Zn-finger protein